MPISKDSLHVTISKKTLQKVNELRILDNRNKSNMVETLLEEALRARLHKHIS